jgi:uncharacterized protein
MFEFDPKKSDSNKIKHGIDFVEAQDLWLDSARVVLPTINLEEVRYLLIAQVKEICWSAVFTNRDNKIRIISVRRSRDNEKQIYFSRGI